MNTCIFIGRLTKEPEIRYTQSGTAVARFSIALDRGKKDGKDLGADYPTIVCFGKTAEAMEKYSYKGQLVGVSASVSTGSYEKDGKKVYTTEFYASRVDFLSRREEKDAPAAPEGFSQLTDDDIPF